MYVSTCCLRPSTSAAHALLWSPGKSWVPPIQILNLLDRQTRQSGIDIGLFPLLIARLHPEQQDNTRNQGRASCGKVQAIPDMVVRGVCGEEGPRANQAADVAHLRTKYKLADIRKEESYRVEMSLKGLVLY